MNRRRANTTSAEMEEGKNDLRSAALPSAAPAADEEAAGPKDEVRNPTQHSSEVLRSWLNSGGLAELAHGLEELLLRDLPGYAHVKAGHEQQICVQIFTSLKIKIQNTTRRSRY